MSHALITDEMILQQARFMSGISTLELLEAPYHGLRDGDFWVDWGEEPAARTWTMDEYCERILKPAIHGLKDMQP